MHGEELGKLCEWKLTQEEAGGEEGEGEREGEENVREGLSSCSFKLQAIVPSPRCFWNVVVPPEQELNHFEPAIHTPECTHEVPPGRSPPPESDC